jgi:hypothetical protein
LVDGEEVQKAGQKLSIVGRRFWHLLESDKARESLIVLEQVINRPEFRELADRVLREGS